MRVILLFATIYMLIAAVACQPLREAKAELELSKRAYRKPWSRSNNAPKVKRKIQGLVAATDAISDMFSRFGSRFRGAKAAAQTTAESAEAHFTRSRSYSPYAPFSGSEANEPLLKSRPKPFDFKGNEAGYTGDADNDYLRAKHYERPPLKFSRDDEVEGFGGRLGESEPAATETEPKKYKHFYQDPNQRRKMLAATAASLLVSALLIRYNMQNIDTAQNLNAAVQASQAQQRAAAEQRMAENAALDASGSSSGTKLERRDIGSSINDEHHADDDSQASQVHLVKRFDPFRAIRERLPETSISESLAHIRQVADSMPSDVKNLAIKYAVGATAMIGTGFAFLFIYFRDRRHRRHHDPAPSPANYTEASSPPSHASVPPDQVLHTRIYKRSIDSAEPDVRSHEDARLLVKEAAAAVAHVKKRALGTWRISKRMAPLERTMEMSTVSDHGAIPQSEPGHRLASTTRELMDELVRWKVPLAVATAFTTSCAFLGIGVHEVIKYLHEVQEDHDGDVDPDSKHSSSPLRKPHERRDVPQGQKSRDGSGSSTSGHRLSKRMFQMHQFVPIAAPPAGAEAHLAAPQASRASSRVAPVEENDQHAPPVDLPGQAAEAVEAAEAAEAEVQWMPPELIAGLTIGGSVAVGAALAALVYAKMKGNVDGGSTRHVESTRSSFNTVEAENQHRHRLAKRAITGSEAASVIGGAEAIAQAGVQRIKGATEGVHLAPATDKPGPLQTPKEPQYRNSHQRRDLSADTHDIAKRALSFAETKGASGEALMAVRMDLQRWWWRRTVLRRRRNNRRPLLPVQRLGRAGPEETSRWKPMGKDVAIVAATGTVAWAAVWFLHTTLDGKRNVERENANLRKYLREHEQAEHAAGSRGSLSKRALPFRQLLQVRQHWRNFSEDFDRLTSRVRLPRAEREFRTRRLRKYLIIGGAVAVAQAVQFVLLLDLIETHVDNWRLKNQLQKEREERRQQQELRKRGMGSYVGGKATNAWEALKVAKVDFQSLGSKAPLRPEDRQARNDRFKKYALFAGHLAAAKAVESYVMYRVVQLHREHKDDKAFQEKSRELQQPAPLQKRGGVMPVSEQTMDAAREVSGTNPELALRARRFRAKLADSLTSRGALYSYAATAIVVAEGFAYRSLFCSKLGRKWPRFCAPIFKKHHAASDAPQPNANLRRRDAVAKRGVQVPQVQDGYTTGAAMVRVLRQLALGSHRAGFWGGDAGESVVGPPLPSHRFAQARGARRSNRGWDSDGDGRLDNPPSRVGGKPVHLLLNSDGHRFVQALFSAREAHRFSRGRDSDGDGRLDKRSAGELDKRGSNVNLRMPMAAVSLALMYVLYRVKHVVNARRAGLSNAREAERRERPQQQRPYFAARQRRDDGVAGL